MRRYIALYNLTYYRIIEGSIILDVLLWLTAGITSLIRLNIIFRKTINLKYPAHVPQILSTSLKRKKKKKKEN